MLLLGVLMVLHGVAQGTQPTTISGEAQAHLTEIIEVLQREWLHREGFDWTAFKQRVFQRAGGAQTIPDTYDAIRVGLARLGDKHTYYIPATGNTIFNPESPTQSTGACTPPASVTPALPGDVGYVQVRVSAGRAGADAVDAAIREHNRAGLIGWIVDLRNSRGGNMWPFLAAIGPVIGDGTLGFFVDANKKLTPWGYTTGRAWLDTETIATIETPQKLTTPNPRVALLTDIGVASSGEAIAIAFQARPNPRSFGTRTCGLSTAVAQFPLKSGGRLAVVTSVMADRTKKTYGNVVEPDEVINDPAEVIPHALAWLRAAR